MHFSLGQVPISRYPPFFSCGCSKPFGTPCFGVVSLRIEKWALECSCVPKGVGATFCSKTGQFFSCGCSKASRVPVCSSSKPFGTPCFGVLSLRIEKWALECSCVPKGSGATFCSKTEPFFWCGCSKASRVPVCPRRPKPHFTAKQSRSFRVAALNWVLSLRIEKKDPRVLVCAQRGRGHILQQNREVLFVWLL